MQGIILAAGSGTRLLEMAKNTPKCLLEIAGQTDTDAYRSWLAEHGRRVLAVKNYEMAQATKRGF